MINVCFITDEKYVILTLVAIKSLIINSQTPLSINVVTTDLSNDSQQLFNQLETVNAKINIIYTDNPCENISNNHEYITNTAYIKFNLQNIFKDLDRMLYIDGDTLILKDLKELYDTDLEDKYAGVVSDAAVCRDSTYIKEYGLKNYFNSGVMLMNLAKMRQDSIDDKLLDYAKNGECGKYVDQDVFNFVFKENVKWLPIKYNFLNLPYTAKFITSYLNISNEEYNDITNSIVISHYAGVIIDRMIEIVHEKDFSLWYKYFNMLPNSNFKTCKAIELLMQYYKIQNNNILLLNKKIDSLQQKTEKENIVQKIFSVKNKDGHKIVTIMFIKMKFKLNKKR